MKSKLILLLLALAGSVLAKENVGSRNRTQSATMKNIAAGCAGSTAKTELAFNNVRTVILINGDMWWDAMASIGPQYEIPKGGGIHSLFSGALWIGGIDASNNLKVAAQTYRQSGSDFWPGPLDTTLASVNPDVCLQYDRHWKLTLDDLKKFKAFTEDPNSSPSYTDADIPDDIKTWPGTGDVSGEHQGRYLAPYVDVDSNGVYDYQAGDYPDHNQLYSTVECGDKLFGDQFIWWVFNDVGNIHTETGGATIGLEIHAQAFVFHTNDEVDNMTFYNYKIINRSSTQINQNYFGCFVDADLGNFQDDYVGCDVPRGLGYCYNGDADDDGPKGYGVNPPAIGVDFFQGPLADPNDTVDNNRNCIIDEPGEQIIMSRFVFYVNDFSNWGNPENATQYYNYLKGIWKNGQVMTYGGFGNGAGNGATAIPCKFMFPGNTDHQWEWGTGGNCSTAAPAAAQADWDEYIAGNLPSDRRFLHSAGPFTLQPGAVNTITTGAVWARATQGGPQASVNLLRIVDDKAQLLFDNCFSILNGPDAPDVTLRELDKEIVLTISNSPSSNNYKELYKEKDPAIQHSIDTLYSFEGYQIFQLKNETVSSSELHNPDRARLVAQVDSKDTISQIVNHYFDFATSSWRSVEEVNGDNKGIRHSFRITTDKFATGDTRLINHKNYFYMVIAYGFNNAEVAPDPYSTTQDGQRQPYIAGRRNVKIYTAIPHNPVPENYGQDLNSIYGNGPKLTRVEGNGNGYLINYHTPDANATDFSSIRLTLDLTAESVAEILDASTGYRSKHPEYEASRGPVNVKVIDPVKVPNADFILWVENINDTAHWYLKNLDSDVIMAADARYSTLSEQLFPDWGLSVTFSKISGPLLTYDGTDDGHGYVEATMQFTDPNKPWLIGVPDGDATANEIDSAFNWIHPPDTALVSGIDPRLKYEKVLQGIWAPYRLVSPGTSSTIWPHSPSYNAASVKQNLGQNLNSVDVIITRDKSKWSRCVVVEANASTALAENGTPKGNPRRTFSINKDGVYSTDTTATSTDPNSPDYISGKGMSWFPGYAIDVEKGERLNIMFAEDSWLAGENGKDMKWNPSSNFISDLGGIQLGGMHFIYIVNSNNDASVNNQMVPYDGCAQIQTLFNSPLLVSKTRIYKNVTWVNFPVMLEGYSMEDNGMVPPCDVKIRLRVARPYSNYGTGNPVDSVSLAQNQTYVVANGRIKYDTAYYNAGQTFTTYGNINSYSVKTNNTSTPAALVLTSGGNNGYPMYTFKTDNLANAPYNVEAAKSALDLINVVPNPYYAYSAYEGTLVAGVSVQPQLDNRVKIVNLPPRCTISIYTVNGILVRRFSRDVAADNSYGSQVTDKNFETSQDWDLKNHKNIPIASGLYLIHVEAKDNSGIVIGERTLKWFGVMRPIDLDSF